MRSHAQSLCVKTGFLYIQTHKSEIPALTRVFTLWDIEVYLTGFAISLKYLYVLQTSQKLKITTPANENQVANGI